MTGYVEELKIHFREIHKINTSHVANVPFACLECGSLYNRFKNLKRHIVEFHPRENIGNNWEKEPDCPSTSGSDRGSDQELTVENDPNYSEITNPIFFEPPVSASEMKQQAEQYVMKMRCDVGLPESKIKDFMQATTDLLQYSGKYHLGIFKSYLKQKATPYDDDDAVKAINKFKIPDVFSNIRTPQDSLSYLSQAAGYAIPIPREVVMGRTKTTKVTRIPSRGLGHPRKVVKNTTVVKHAAHYIPIVDTLALILQNDQARVAIANETPNDGFLQGFKDGERFKNHPLLNAHPDALRLAIHIDDVEYLNALGSRKGNKKLTNVSFKIENFNPVINSNPDRIYLALTVHTKDLKKYGYAKVLRPLIKDLLRLESEDGVKIAVKGQEHILRAVLVHVVGDTLAIHEIFELMGPQSKIFCRMCYASRDLLHQGSFGDVYCMKTPESIRTDLEAIALNLKKPSECGVIRECALHQLKYFNIASNYTFDPMHDVLEGVGMMVMKLILRDLVINKKLITVDQLNGLIRNFNYGIAEKQDKPSPNFSVVSLKSRNNAISQSAAQSWVLLRAFLFIFNTILSTNSNYICLVGSLLKICFYSFSYKLTHDHVQDLEIQIQNFFKLFQTCFPLVNPINKIHHLSHYPLIIRQDGPIANHSCMPYEAKFKESKRQAKTCNNFMNLTYSLTKRLNLKQVNTILNQNYSNETVSIISSANINKNTLEYGSLLNGFPDVLTSIKHMQINKTSFRPDLIVKYNKCGEVFYGVIKVIAQYKENFAFVIEELKCVAFCEAYNSYKVTHTNKMVRISKEKLFTRKTYSLWQLNGVISESYYISLKYNDD